MKLILTYWVALLLVTAFVFYSCKKEFSCENCLPKNQPPVANAGKDTTLTLPINSIRLDGSKSTDPDNDISSYKWTLIAGPASFSLADANAMQTQLTGLDSGAYQFELMVTDSTGLLDRDTVTVTVRPQGSTTDTGTLNCNITTLHIGRLPTPGAVRFSAAAGSKILFVRNSGVVDIYDTLTSRWESKTGMYATGNYLPEQKANILARVGTKLVFSAPVDPIDPSEGQLVNIYDFVSNSWVTTRLAQARSFYAMAVVGNKVFYAGGNNHSQKMDVYDANSNSWSVMDFKEARGTGMVGIGFGGKAYFAGGYIERKDSLVLQCDDFGNNCNYYPAIVATNRIDVLDISTNTWSVEYLREARGHMCTAIVGNRLVFAGGEIPSSGNSYSSVVDFYNTSTHSWQTHDLGPGNPIIFDYNIFIVQSKLLIPHANSNLIHIYDNNTDSWSAAQMPYPFHGDMLERGKVASVGNKMMFFYQYYTHPNHQKGGIDIYDAATNSWCHSQLDYDLARAGFVQTGNRLLFAGGFTMSGCCSFNGETDKMWEFKF